MPRNAMLAIRGMISIRKVNVLSQSKEMVILVVPSGGTINARNVQLVFILGAIENVSLFLQLAGNLIVRKKFVKLVILDTGSICWVSVLRMLRNKLIWAAISSEMGSVRSVRKGFISTLRGNAK